IGKQAIESADPGAGGVARLRVSRAYALLRSPKHFEIMVAHDRVSPVIRSKIRGYTIWAGTRATFIFVCRSLDVVVGRERPGRESLTCEAQGSVRRAGPPRVDNRAVCCEHFANSLAPSSSQFHEPTSLRAGPSSVSARPSARSVFISRSITA